MEIPKKLKDEIWEYCRLNDIPNIDEFIIKMVRQGYTVEKFGSTPMERKEVIEVEKIIEVPVEVVKEVIVEKEVTKIEYISDKTTENDLLQKFSTITEELEVERQISSTKITELENNFQDIISEKDLEINKLHQEIVELNKKNNIDIYDDERRGGWFGSNLLNRK